MKIIRLWVVERFVEEKRGLTMEEAAEEYLNELVSRSMIQVVQIDYFNRVRTCRVHDVMREIIQLKSRNESFVLILNDKRMSLDEKIRRMAIHDSCEELPLDLRFPSLRSLLVFASSISLGEAFFKGFRLLGLLELDGTLLFEFPPELSKMIHLRYLSLRRTRIRELPESIGKLKNLEILDIKHTLISTLPHGILKLKHLFQLRGYGNSFHSSTHFPLTHGMSLPVGIGGLTKLQKLGNVEVNGNGDMVREFGKLIELKRLGILQRTRENGMDLCYALEKLKHLSALYMVSNSTTEPLLHLDSLSTPPRFIQRLYLKCRLPNLPNWIASLSYLAKLVLQYSNLNDDPLKARQGLPNLVVLELRDAYAGEELCCDVGGYPRLRKLGLLMLRQLKSVRMEQGSMPELRGLDIAACEKLEMVPLGIQHLRNLQDLTVWNMPDKFHQKIERPHGEDFWRVQNVTNIQLSKFRKGYICLENILLQSGKVGSKSTLVKKAYDSQVVKKYFDCHAWITVSKSFTAAELLRSALKEMLEEAKEIIPVGFDTMGESQVVNKLKEYLQEKRYVVVFDDVWGPNAWEVMKFAPPDCCSGSRIVFTTRKSDIAASIEIFSHVYRLQPLPEEEAWKLFCMKAFRRENKGVCPKELESMSRSMLKKCGGLPLAIVAIGSLLSIKDKLVLEWMRVHDSLYSEMKSDSSLESLERILLLSYHDLPYHLKCCFLYLSIFPGGLFNQTDENNSVVGC
ncbi:hypothetical protein RHMOL_Rhmol09G0040700 [Rhododendron molle]|uniref:Uncharacterized protein n=1 Tax=Rhododendron molle TaxID=49168 RepID=A0ACC0MB74_RHOML|nr:hypothetical protein RHMOL_Rhmol09G0040700 [Rhododendron molle]